MLFGCEGKSEKQHPEEPKPHTQRRRVGHLLIREADSSIKVVRSGLFR